MLVCFPLFQGLKLNLKMTQLNIYETHHFYFFLMRKLFEGQEALASKPFQQLSSHELVISVFLDCSFHSLNKFVNYLLIQHRQLNLQLPYHLYSRNFKFNHIFLNFIVPIMDRTLIIQND